MNFLGLDIGSSSVKAGVLREGRVIGKIVHAFFATHHDGLRAEVDPNAVLGAVGEAVKQLGSRARKVDAIGLSVMSPAWVAMDKSGKPLTPIVTHQDRRSVEIARDLVHRVGRQRFLKLAGNLPFPGGISVTTWAWYLRNEPGRLKRADLCGHLSTFMQRQLTGGRVIDPSNASFTGLYSTCDQRGWSDELCEAAGVPMNQLPQILESNGIGGKIRASAAQRLGLTEGTPLLAGIVDTSSAMMLIGARAGQLLNVCGSTDVLGLCTARAHPHERLLTRALGVGKKWMSVSTLAAAGSSLLWAKDQFFAEIESKVFWKLLAELARNGRREAATVRFEPYLAGERAAIEQRQGAFTGLTLASTRRHMLAAIVESLAEASAARFALLRQHGVPIRRDVVVSGGVQNGLDKILHRDWPGRWTFRVEEEASLRGLSLLIPK
jgi:xylulokinase